MKQIVLCADDFGQNPAISNSIAQLLAQQRLSATSCMTNSEHWSSQATLLRPFINQADLGLHFNLTHGKALTHLPTLAPNGILPSLATVLFKSQLQRLSATEIEQELAAQIEAFKQALGRLPDYIDGHQHIHQFPVIREALVKVYLHYYPNKNAYIRVLDFQPCNMKEWILHILGAQELKSLLQANQIPHNTSFGGIYNLKATANYRKLFQNFLARSNDRGIIMCHAGLVAPDKADPISAARNNEYHYFASEDFIFDCAAANVVVVPLK